MTPFAGRVQVFFPSSGTLRGELKSLPCLGREGLQSFSGYRDFLDVFPTTLCGRGQDGITDLGGFKGIAEGWITGLPTAQGRQEVCHLMHEGVLVTDTEPGNPPLVEIRVVTVTDVNAAPAADRALVGVVEILKPVKVVEIPADGGIFTVDLEGVERLVAPRITGRLEESEGSVGKVAVEEAGIVDGNGLLFTGSGVHPLLDEGFGHRGDIADVAIKPDRGIDAVGEEVASDSGSGRGSVKAPEPLSSLWKFLTDGPVLKEVGAVVEDLTQFPGIDDLFGEGNCRDPAVVVPNGVGNSGFLHGLHHGGAFLSCTGERFLAQDHLTSFRRCDCDGSVGVIGSADVNRVDVIAGDQGLPVGFHGLVAPLGGKGIGAFLVTGADGLQDGPVFDVGKEVVNPLVSVAVGSAHEAVAYKTDVEWFFFAHDEVFCKRELVPVAAMGIADLDHGIEDRVPGRRVF